jgi:hypothetical protein
VPARSQAPSAGGLGVLCVTTGCSILSSAPHPPGACVWLLIHEVLTGTLSEVLLRPGDELAPFVARRTLATTADAGTKSSKLSPGLLAAIITIAVLASALVVCIIVHLLRRSRQPNENVGNSDGFQHLQTQDSPLPPEPDSGSTYDLPPETFEEKPTGRTRRPPRLNIPTDNSSTSDSIPRFRDSSLVANFGVDDSNPQLLSPARAWFLPSARHGHAGRRSIAGSLQSGTSPTSPIFVAQRVSTSSGTSFHPYAIPPQAPYPTSPLPTVPTLSPLGIRLPPPTPPPAGPAPSPVLERPLPSVPPAARTPSRADRETPRRSRRLTFGNDTWPLPPLHTSPSRAASVTSVSTHSQPDIYPKRSIRRKPVTDAKSNVSASRASLMSTVTATSSAVSSNKRLPPLPAEAKSSDSHGQRVEAANLVPASHHGLSLPSAESVVHGASTHGVVDVASVRASYATFGGPVG